MHRIGGSVFQRMMRLPARLGCWLNRVMGGLFVGLGIKLAVE